MLWCGWPSVAGGDQGPTYVSCNLSVSYAWCCVHACPHCWTWLISGFAFHCPHWHHGSMDPMWRPLSRITLKRCFAHWHTENFLHCLFCVIPMKWIEMSEYTWKVPFSLQLPPPPLHPPPLPPPWPGGHGTRVTRCPVIPGHSGQWVPWHHGSDTSHWTIDIMAMLHHDPGLPPPSCTHSSHISTSTTTTTTPLVVNHQSLKT